MRHWHPGKIALIWVGAVAFSYATRQTDGAAAGVLALIVAAVMTWRWLSTREQRLGASPKGTALDSESAESPVPSLTTEQLAAALFLFVRPFREREERVRAALQGAELKFPKEVEWELFALRRFAIELTIRVVVEARGGSPAALLKAFGAQFNESALQQLTTPKSSSALQKRVAAYWQSVTSDTNLLPRVVGAEFALHCGSCDQAVVMLGATEFSSTVTAGKNTILQFGVA